MAPHVTLPDQIAPAMVERIEALLAEVPLATERRTPNPERTAPAPRCVVCHRDGKLGGHHEPDGSVVWIHRRCHRHLHQRHRLSRDSYARVRHFVRHDS